MTIDASKALQFETEFLSGVGTNLDAVKGKHLRGSVWQRAQYDESDRLRELMANNRNYDRELVKSLPSNRRVAWHGFERRLVFWKRRTGVAVASVLSPLSHYAKPSPGDVPPIGLGELTDHVRQLVADARVPHVIGVCSPSGFTEEAREVSLSSANVQVVLIEPDGAGGWRTTAAGEGVDPRLLRIFDPESTKQKLERVYDAVEERSADLLTGVLSSSSVAREVNLPPEMVREGFKRVAATNPELKLTEKEDEFLLFRGAPVQHREKKSMNVIDRIRQLFSGEGDEAEKINLLGERRAALAQRRDRIYEDIGKLEKKEADLFEQGKTAKSQVPKRRIAAQLAQLRKDIARQNRVAGMLNQQIDIISTDIHNLTLIQQGEVAQLPDATELTENAVKAEELLESLKADSELVGGLEADMDEAVVSEDELAILREFEEADREPAAAERAAPAPAPPVEAERQAGTAPEPTADEPPPAEPEAPRRPADAEPT